MSISKIIKLSVAGLALVSITYLPSVWAEDSWNDINSTKIGTGMKKDGSSVKNGSYKRKLQDKEGLFKQLELTESQKEKMKALFQNKRQQNQAEHQTVMMKREQLVEMLKTGSGSREQALSLQREISQAHSNMMTQRINMVYDLRAILTPEQFEKFQAMMHKKFQNRKPGGANGGMSGFNKGGGMHMKGPQGFGDEEPPIE